LETIIRFIADAEDIDLLAGAMAASEGAEVLRIEDVDDAGTGADFALESAVALVGLVQTLFVSGPIVPALRNLFRAKPESRIVIETPSRSLTITSSDALTDAQIKSLLAVALDD
jgi:hypothetical protein